MKTYCIDWFEQELCELEGGEGYLVRKEAHELVVKELQSRLESLEKDANECRLSLVAQIHELADHIERAAPFCNDVDMRKQMIGQREFALMVSAKWNQNGNPFTAMQANKGE